jgi:hypothetical protein
MDAQGTNFICQALYLIGLITVVPPPTLLSLSLVPAMIAPMIAPPAANRIAAHAPPLN